MVLLLEHQRQAPRYEAVVTTMGFAVLVANVGTAGLSAVGLELWVPLLLSSAAAIQSMLSYTQLSLRLESANAVVCQLNQLLCWWQGLTIIERRIECNREFLIETCESVYLSANSSVVAAAAKAKSSRPKSDTEADDEAKLESKSA